MSKIQMTNHKHIVLLIYFCLAVTSVGRCENLSQMWWPVQKVPKAIVKAVDYEQLVVSPNGKSTTGNNGATHMLVESIAGLTAQAVNEGRCDEMVWIDDQRPDYIQWYKGMVKRLNPEVRGGFTPWQLVERYRDKGIIKGYVLYSYDYSEGDVFKKRQQIDYSANVATVAAGLAGGILIEEGQQAKAEELGLKLLFDARGKEQNWCFNEYKNRLNRNILLTMDPKVPNNRDMAIAHRCMVVYGTDESVQTVLAWLNPLSPILGWNYGQEDEHTSIVSSWGHFETASNWCMNLPILSADSAGYTPSPVKTLNPSGIDYNDTGIFTSFVLSDGDNVQWLMGGFFHNSHYWASDYNGKFPFGWSTCSAHLTQVCPDAIDYLSKTQPENASILEFSGGYYYPDTFAENRPNRYELLAEHAGRISAQMKKNGTRVLIFICQDVNSINAKKAYEIFAEQIDGLVGMVALQYYPYNGGDGKVFWVKNKDGIEIPVVTAKYAIWSRARWSGGGSPAKIVKLINDDAVVPMPAGHSIYELVAVHSWSKFVGCDEVDEQKPSQTAEQGLAPIACAVRQLSQNVHVVNPEEMFWRMRMEHNRRETLQVIEKLKNTAGAATITDIKDYAYAGKVYKTY